MEIGNLQLNVCQNKLLQVHFNKEKRDANAGFVEFVPHGVRGDGVNGHESRKERRQRHVQGDWHIRVAEGTGLI